MSSNIEFHRNTIKNFFNLNVKLTGEIFSSGDFWGDSVHGGFYPSNSFLRGILSARDFIFQGILSAEDFFLDPFNK